MTAEYHILARFRQEVVHKDLLMVRLGQIFAELSAEPGFARVALTACPQRDDADFCVALVLAPEAQKHWREAGPFRVFLAEFGPLLSRMEIQEK